MPDMPLANYNDLFNLDEGISEQDYMVEENEMDFVKIETFECLPDFFSFNYKNNFCVAANFIDFFKELNTSIEIPDLHCFDGNKWFIPINYLNFFVSYLNLENYTFELFENECNCHNITYV